MNTREALEYLQQLFENVPDVEKNYNAGEKRCALEKAKESIELFRKHETLLTIDTVKLLKEVSLKNPGIFTELSTLVAKGIIRIHAIGPQLSLARIIHAVDICIISTTYRPSENLNEFISQLQNLRDFNSDLITNKNLDKLIYHYTWGRIKDAITQIINEHDSSPLNFFKPLRKIDVGIIDLPQTTKKTETLVAIVKPNASTELKKLKNIKGLISLFPKLESVISKTESQTNQLEYFLENYPADSIWRLFIDADRKKITPTIFDRSEPGYIVSCMRAFFNLLSDFDTTVTPDFIKQIHKDATKDVGTFPTSGMFRTSTPHKFGFGTDVSLLGLNELESMQGELNYTVIRDDSFPATNKSHYRVMCGKVDDSFISSKIEIITKAYEDRLREIPNEIFPENPEDAKKLKFFLHLENIVLMTQKLERLHPFSDGNCRTFCMLLLNRELIRNKLPPCLLTNPNDFDGLSQSEMINEVLAGQNRYFALCTGAKSLRYGGTAICNSFEIACELDFKSHEESLLLALEAANRSSDNVTKSEILEKINTDLSASLGGPRILSSK